MDKVYHQNYIIIYKKRGETPLQALHRLRIERPQLASATLSYAGRLDPLAEGELLVLIGDACKHRGPYMNLDKTYTVDILFGISTDTGDVMGVRSHLFPSSILFDIISNIEITNACKKFIGEQTQTFPVYSSKNIKNVLANKNVETSSKKVNIYSIELKDFSTITKEALQKDIEQKIGSVVGNFRQEEIQAAWNDYFKSSLQEKYTVAKIKVHCSSGTYMRVLAEDIGKALQVPALALSIKREKIHILSLL